MSKKKKIFVIAFIAVIVLAAISSNGETDSVSSTSESVADTSQPEEITEANELETIVKNNIKQSYEDFSILQNENYLLVEYTVPATYTADSLIYNSLTSYVNICKEAYAYDDAINDIQIMIKTYFTDAKGNVITSKAVQFEMNKENFETYNWDNLEYISVYDQFSNDCETFYIDSAIDFNTDKFYYVG